MGKAQSKFSIAGVRGCTFFATGTQVSQLLVKTVKGSVLGQLRGYRSSHLFIPGDQAMIYDVRSPSFQRFLSATCSLSDDDVAKRRMEKRFKLRMDRRERLEVGTWTAKEIRVWLGGRWMKLASRKNFTIAELRAFARTKGGEKQLRHFLREFGPDDDTEHAAFTEAWHLIWAEWKEIERINPSAKSCRKHESVDDDVVFIEALSVDSCDGAHSHDSLAAGSTA